MLSSLVRGLIVVDFSRADVVNFRLVRWDVTVFSLVSVSEGCLMSCCECSKDANLFYWPSVYSHASYWMLNEGILWLVVDTVQIR